MIRAVGMAGLMSAVLAAAGCSLLPAQDDAEAARADRGADAPPADAPPALPPVELAELAELRLDQVTALLGEPDVARAEGVAAALVYAGGDCALHVFLYPDTAGAAPQVSHVETIPARPETVEHRACLERLLTRRAE